MPRQAVVQFDALRWDGVYTPLCGCLDLLTVTQVARRQPTLSETTNQAVLLPIDMQTCQKNAMATAGADSALQKRFETAMRRTETQNVDFHGYFLTFVKQATYRVAHWLRLVIEAEFLKTCLSWKERIMKKAYLVFIGGMTLTQSVGAAQWSQWDPNVGNGHFYSVTDTALTWYDARTEAVNLGGYLTSIGSLEELNFVRSSFGRLELFWTGLSTVNGNQAFEWDSGESVGFTYFGAHQPDAGQLGSVVINNLNSRGFTRGFFMEVSPLESHRGIVERNTDPNAQTGGGDPNDPPTQQVPDGGSSVILLGASVLLTGLMGRLRR